MEGNILVPALGCAAGIVCFGWGFSVWRRMRLIVDTPTAKVRSMPMGRVELQGRAQEKAELAAPITKTPCVYYRYLVEEERRSGKHNTWVTVDQGDSSAWAFRVEDETGAVLVVPERAKVEIGCDFEAKHGGLSGLLFGRDKSLDPSPWTQRGWLGVSIKKLRFREWRIHAGETLYVLGVAQERGNLAAERRERILDKLRALKADPEAMAHFDRDGDGEVSDPEWEIARQLVVQEVMRGSVDDRVVIAADPARDAPFLISDHGEASLVSRHYWQALLGVFGGAATSIGSLWVLLVQLGSS